MASVFSRLREKTRHVKRWRDGEQARRWAAWMLVWVEARMKPLNPARRQLLAKARGR